MTPAVHSPPRAGRIPLHLLLVLCLGLLALPGGRAAGAGFDSGPTGTAGAADRDKISDEIDRTETVIQRAAEQLQGCSNRKGAALLEEAKRLQEKARESIGGPTTPAGASRALAYTRKARELAVQAIEACLEPVAEDALRRLLDEAEGLYVQMG